MQAQARRRYAFGDFEMDPAERRLTRRGRPLAVLPKVFDVLVLLVERGGRLVTKQEILEAAWPNVEVQESSLTATMSRLRALLEDHGRHGTYIETVTGHGYRFTAPVEVLDASQRRGDSPIRSSLGLRSMPIVAGVALLALMASTRLAMQSGAEETGRADEQAEAAYRRGAALLATRRHSDEALEAFQEAVRLAPGHSRAHAGMAQVYAMEVEAASLVRESASRAIELDIESADAWSALGFSRAMHEWDWAGAEGAFHRALEIAPDNAGTLQWLATIRMIQRRFDEADRLLARALRAEVRPGLYADRCQLAVYRGAFLDAASQCEHASQLDPAHPWANAWRLRLALATGDGALAASLAGVAEYHGMELLLDTLIARMARAPGRNAPLGMAEALALQGEHDAALAALERAVAAHAFLAPFANADPAYDGVRDDPRFRRAMARMGL